ncbi:MAG TPA: sulfatase [Clostridiales bacterium]|nr:sulfatase [Clostridiales bacterium]
MNVLYLHTHDTGRVISPYGYKVPTPNYESFCQENLLFQNAFCVAPTCSPSRAGLLTGCYPHQNGMLGLAQRGFELDKEKHLANFLKDRGFQTVLCGVQHEYAYYLDHDLAKEPLGYLEDISCDCKKYEESDLIYWDQENADGVCNWLESYNGEKPFFLSYGMHCTHREFPKEIHETINVDFSQPPINIFNNKITREDFARYKTSLRIADGNIGKIVRKMKDINLYDQTIIIITTDHGIAYPFSKCTLNDTGIGVLMAMRYPDAKLKSNSYDGLISHIDIFPTICDLLGLEKPDYLVGKSFAGIFKGEDYEGDDLIFAEINFHTSYEPARCVRTKRYKYIRFFDEEYNKLNYSNIDSSPIKDFLKDYQLMEVTKDYEALYDLYYDPVEQKNIIQNERYQEVAEELRKSMRLLMEKTKDPLLHGPIRIKPEWKVNKKECFLPGSKNEEDYESLGDNQYSSYH